MQHTTLYASSAWSMEPGEQFMLNHAFDGSVTGDFGTGCISLIDTICFLQNKTPFHHLWKPVYTKTDEFPENFRKGGEGALRDNPGSAKMWKWSKSDENSGKFRQNCTFHEKTFIFVCRIFFFFSSKWIIWHTLMIALFSEKIVCCFLKNFFLKVVASTLLSSHTCV